MVLLTAAVAADAVQHAAAAAHTSCGLQGHQLAVVQLLHPQAELLPSLLPQPLASPTCRTAGNEPP